VDREQARMSALANIIAALARLVGRWP
jgi:hypothetical protein